MLLGCVDLRPPGGLGPGMAQDAAGAVDDAPSIAGDVVASDVSMSETPRFEVASVEAAREVLQRDKWPPNAMTDGGGADGPIEASATREALLVTDGSTQDPSEKRLAERLAQIGFTVRAVHDETLEAADAARAAVVVLPPVISGIAVARLRATAVPIVLMTVQGLAPLRMTGNVEDTHFGEIPDRRSLSIADSGHPLAAGLSGAVAATTTDQPMGWGAPTAAAVKVATPAIYPNRHSIFGYERGVALVDAQPAPDRRVFLWAVQQATVNALSAEGWALFDAAVRWAAAR